jgi:hypothetical protein
MSASEFGTMRKEESRDNQKRDQETASRAD